MNDRCVECGILVLGPDSTGDGGTCLKSRNGVHVFEAVEEAIPMLLWCPDCGARHIDRGEFKEKLHHTHSCQECGMTWRPAIVATVGVRFLPGFKDGDE